MPTLAQTIAATSVRPNSVMAWWLGGTGFVFKTSAGTQLYVDPYFSNCVARIFGVERAFPPPIPVEEAAPHLLVATHWHEDHLDPEGLPILARRSDTRFLGPPSCRARLLGWLIPADRVTAISTGESHTFRDITIRTVAARHIAGIPGWETPDAIGLLIEAEGLRIYHTGDTEYDLRLRALAYDKERRIDAMLTVINGTGGNVTLTRSTQLQVRLDRPPDALQQVIYTHFGFPWMGMIALVYDPALTCWVADVKPGARAASQEHELIYVWAWVVMGRTVSTIRSGWVGIFSE